MGAENSHSSSSQDYYQYRKHNRGSLVGDTSEKISPKGKPAPPEGFPKVIEVTHDCVKLSWLPARGQSSGSILAYTVEVFNISEKRWRVMTRTCQGTTYYAKNLSANSEYYFRVRAENIYGTGKPSQLTNIVRTKYQGETEGIFSSNKPMTRSCSYTLELENGIHSLISRSNRERGENPFQRNSLRSSLPIMQRKNSFRMSLPPQQRKPVTSFMPGSRRESVHSLKDAVIATDGSVIVEPLDMDCMVEDQRLSMASSEGDSSAKSSSGVSMMSLPSNDDVMSDGHDTDTDDCCVQKESSCDIREASVSDDTKLKTLFSKPSPTDDNPVYEKMACNQTNEPMVWRGRQKNLNSRYNFSDLRTVRQVLRSSDVVVTMSNNDNGDCYNSLPYPNNRFKKMFPCSIQEVEEEEITMDRVSTL